MQTKSPGSAPEWPGKDGAHIYCYLKPFEGASSLLQVLADSAQPVIFYSGNAFSAMQFGAENVRFTTDSLDLDAVGESCDLAILNGNHDSCAQLLLRGVPVLNIPLHREQQLFAQKAEQTGACLTADRHDLDDIVAKLNRLVSNPTFAQRAAAFAAEHAQSQSAANPVAAAVTRELHRRGAG